MCQKITGQSKTTSPEYCPHSKPRKASKVSIARHFILSQESLWVCLYREHTETGVGYSDRRVHTHDQKKRRCTSHPTEWALEQARAQQRQQQLCSRTGEQSMAPQAGSAPSAHVYSLSCFLQEICSCADLRILSPFPQSMEGQMKCTA